MAAIQFIYTFTISAPGRKKGVLCVVVRIKGSATRGVCPVKGLIAPDIKCWNQSVQRFLGGTQADVDNNKVLNELAQKCDNSSTTQESLPTTSEKAGQGWFGTLELHGTNIPAPYIYYGQSSTSGKYDIALFTDNELILIEPDPGALFCDPAWASCSTHWCFKAR